MAALPSPAPMLALVPKLPKFLDDGEGPYRERLGATRKVEVDSEGTEDDEGGWYWYDFVSELTEGSGWVVE